MPDVVQRPDGLQLVSAKGIRRVVVQQWSLPIHEVADIASGEAHLGVMGALRAWRLRAAVILGALAGCGSGALAPATSPDAAPGTKGDATSAGAPDAGEATVADGVDATRSPDAPDAADAGPEAAVCGDASCAAGRLCVYFPCPGGPAGISPVCPPPPPPQCIDVPDACATVSCACPKLDQACGAGGCGSVHGAAVYCAPSE